MDKQAAINLIIQYLRNQKANKIGLFGSFARDEEAEDSDIDILI
ncbi:nucleotidyltransferase domain-containing protein, partial [Candidatus Margulisiibacteriota bacterium]